MNTPSILQKILSQKLKRIAEEKELVNLKDMISLAEKAKQRKSFYDALKKDGLSIIGEIKKASPSRGLIKADFNPKILAKKYEICVDALSILTEEDFFQGKYGYLESVSKVVDLPILFKDFIADEYQIYKAKAIGASAVLLIVAMLDKSTIVKFIKLANSLGLDALVETHSVVEAKIALDSGAVIIGINNRNLHTFNVDLQTTMDIAHLIAKDKIIVSESGINSREDIIMLKDANINAILVGESFMRCDDIEVKAKEFRDAYTS